MVTFFYWVLLIAMLVIYCSDPDRLPRLRFAVRWMLRRGQHPPHAIERVPPLHHRLRWGTPRR